MRFAILTGTRHGEKTPVVIRDATFPVTEQKAAYKEFARTSEHPEFAEVQLWLSDAGITAKRRLKAPKTTDDVSEQQQADDKAAAELAAKAAGADPVTTAPKKGKGKI